MILVLLKITPKKKSKHKKLMWPWWERRVYFQISFFSWCDLLFFYWPEWRCMDLVHVCSVYSWWWLLSTPLVSIHPMIPSRLSGRAADRLSDEMMTLLWEVIPKWKVSGKDCTPSHTATPFLPRLAASCADHDWFASDGSQEAPIDFPVFYQKYLFTVVSLGHGCDLYCQFPNGTWWKRDDSPHPMTR